MNAPIISFTDRKQLTDELKRLPEWLYGGVTGEKGVLLAAGLPARWVHGHPLTGTPTIDSEIVVTNLLSLGHLEGRPHYYALGALVEHLLNNTPHVEGKLFLANLLHHYQLITDLEYLRELGEKYPLLQVPVSGDSLDLGWETEQPAFEWHGPNDPDQLEAMWSMRARFLDAVFLEKGGRVARAVCLVESNSGCGTGFLVGPNLVLTNHHVVPTDDEAQETRVHFRYRLDEAAQLGPVETYQVQRALRRSVEKELDYVVLEMGDAPSGDASIEYLRPVPKKLKKGQSVFIIQHPDGEPQKVVLQDNWITFVAGDHSRVQYMTNTKRGSSGSPVCDEKWDVVALHHSASPLPASLHTMFIRGNEGIPMVAILPEITDLLPPG